MEPWYWFVHSVYGVILWFCALRFGTQDTTMESEQAQFSIVRWGR